MQPFVQYAVGRLPGEELYDLSSDPDCLTNLADEASHAETRKEMSNRLMTILRDTNDPRVTGDGETFDQPPFADPVGKRKRKSTRE